MSPLFYVIRRHLKNIIRGLAQKPLALIGYILIGILMLGSIIVVLIMPSGSVRHGSNESFSAIFTMIVIVVLYFSLRQGIEKGSSYFRFADVNLIFTAPIKPNKVLLYGFIKHMGTSLLIVLFTLFQIPNIKNNFMLKGYGIWMILLTVLFYSLLYPILGMVLYVITSESIRKRNRTKRILDMLMILFATGLIFRVIGEKDFFSAAVQYLNSGIFTWFPFVGQLRTIVSAAVYGIDTAFYLSITILTGVIAAFIVVLYKTNLDYYEDVLVATEHMEQRIKAKRQGRGSGMEQSKVRKIKSVFTTKGAAAIFQKHFIEYRKTSYILFFDKASFIIILAGIVFQYIMPNESEFKIFLMLFFSAYMLFFFVVQGKWPQEMDKPFIFLIPEPDSKKLLYSTLTENIKNFLDGILLFGIAYILYEKSLPVIIFCVISYMLYGAVYIYGDIVSRRLFGSTHSKTMQIFIKLFVSLVVVVPGVVLAMIAYFTLESKEIAVMTVALWNFLAVFVLFLASKGVFRHIETT